METARAFYETSVASTGAVSLWTRNGSVGLGWDATWVGPALRRRSHCGLLKEHRSHLRRTRRNVNSLRGVDNGGSQTAFSARFQDAVLPKATAPVVRLLVQNAPHDLPTFAIVLGDI